VIFDHDDRTAQHSTAAHNQHKHRTIGLLSQFQTYPLVGVLLCSAPFDYLIFQIPVTLKFVHKTYADTHGRKNKISMAILHYLF
jgi:hypothetical protein